MKNIRKFGLSLVLTASVSLSNCSSEQSLTKPDTITSTVEDNKKDTAADTQENKKEDTDKTGQREDKKEDTDKEGDTDRKEDTQQNDQQLTGGEKSTIDEFVERLEKYETGTAGTSLKMDKLFTEIVNRCEFLETKPEQSQQYFIKKVSEVKDTENFKVIVKVLRNTMDYYKEDKQVYIRQLEDSGSEWNPQIRLGTLENLVNNF